MNIYIMIGFIFALIMTFIMKKSKDEDLKQAIGNLSRVWSQDAVFLFLFIINVLFWPWYPLCFLNKIYKKIKIKDEK